MSLELIDLLFNGVVMLFWIRLWNPRWTILRANPYLAGADSMTQPALDLFRERGRSSSVGVAASLWLGLILFRGLALPWAGADRILQAWVLQLGFTAVSPVGIPFSLVPTCIIFSFLSFAVFLFKVWGFSMLIMMGRCGDQTSCPVTEFLHAAAQPFSMFLPLRRLGILLGYGILVGMVMKLVQPSISHDLSVSASTLILNLAQTGVGAAAGIVNLLMTLQSLLLILIIGSWVAMFGGGGTLVMRCQEWLNVILKPFRRFPLHLGPLDLTPILAFIAYGVVNWILNGPMGLLRLLFLHLEG